MTSKLLTIGLFLGAALAASGPQAQTDAAGEPQPNVLMIAIDDLNDWVGVLGGHPQAQTTALDRLAEMGTLFINAHTAAPSCNPSRTAALLGKLPTTTGMYFNHHYFETVMPDATTLPGHFRASGYHTMGGGKIFHRAVYPTEWDEYFPSMEQNRPVDPVPAERPLSYHEKGQFDWGPLPIEAGEMGDAKVADWAVSQLEQTYDEPFFLGVGFFRPHLPMFYPESFQIPEALDATILPEVPEDDLDDVPEAGQHLAHFPNEWHSWRLDEELWKSAVSAYLSSTKFVDAQVGRVLDALASSPHADNTIVVLWSDHGFHLGEKDHWLKFTLWEPSTHVYMAIMTPDSEPGTVIQQPASLIDIFPTLTDLAGIETPPGLDGRSLRPLLEDPTTEWPYPAITSYGPGNTSVRDERWRYIRYLDGSEELYDHDADPHEYVNLAEEPGLEEVKARLAAAIPEDQAPYNPEGQPNWWYMPGTEPTVTWREWLRDLLP